MNATIREILRNLILIQLASGGERGLTPATVVLGVRIAAIPATDEEVREETSYLCDKGYCVEVAKNMSPENRRHRITASGRDYLATEGLV